MTQIVRALKEADKVANERNRSQTFPAIVVDNEDPEGMQKIRVQCSQLYGEGVSPWCICDVIMGGDGFGLVITPQIGDKVNIEIQNNDISVPRYCLSAREVGNIPPEEFSTSKVNGIKTPSGVLIVWDDEDGSIKLKNGGSSFVYINGEGEIWVSGEKVYTSGQTFLNAGNIPIALGGPDKVCAITGNPVPSSASCFASEV